MKHVPHAGRLAGLAHARHFRIMAMRIFMVVLCFFVCSCGTDVKPLVPSVVVALGDNPTTAIVAEAVSPSPGVRVTTSDGTPVPGVSVTFAVTGGVGGVTNWLQETDAQGVARVGRWTMGTVAGNNTLTATVADIAPVEITVVAVAGAPASVTLSVAPSAIVMNRVPFPVQPTVQLYDRFNNVSTRSGVWVEARITSSGALLLGNVRASTDATGAATFSGLFVAGTAGEHTIGFGGTSGGTSANVTVIAGPAETLSMHNGNDQTAAAGASVPVRPAVRLADIDDNPIPGVTVTFAVGSGGGSVTEASQTTDANGIATVGSWTLGSAGPNTLTATATPLPGLPVTFTATGQ